jgi:hypothetical protein
MDRDAILDRLGFEIVGDISSELLSKFSCAITSKGWIVVVGRGASLRIDATLAALPPELQALGCELSDVVMWARVRAMKGGKQLWAVEHNGEKTPRDLIQGDPPPQVAEFKRRLEMEQAAEDEAVDHLFDLPNDVSESVCGYRGGEGSGLEWIALRHRKGGGSRDRAPSLLTAMKSALLPDLSDRGWAFDPELAISEVGGIYRDLSGISQTIWVGYSDVTRSNILVRFSAYETATPKSGFRVYGLAKPAPTPSFWSRLISGRRQQPRATVLFRGLSPGGLRAPASTRAGRRAGSATWYRP